MRAGRIQKMLRMAFFVSTAVLSSTVLRALLRVQLGKNLIGLCLLGFLLFSLVYAAGWYLRLLWRASGRIARIPAGGPAASDEAMGARP